MSELESWRLRFGVAFFITIINISVFCIWIPAQLGISDTYVNINRVWDRVEKAIFLLIDASLNYYFIKIVKETLVQRDLTKYSKLVNFNVYMIVISLSMDVVVIGMMSLEDSLV